jgi:hypothetical protein
MALDVWIGKPTRFKGGPSVSFEPEAYYSFLYELFEEFAEVHGQMIDPYDGAIFQPSELAPVLELVDRAKELVSAQPEEFDVYMGKNLGSYYEPKDEDIYFKVKRHEYLNFIERLRQTVLEAQKAGKEVVFFGD